MTREETKTIIRTIMATYPAFKPQNLSETIDIWASILSDDSFERILAALKTYIRTSGSPFAPSVSELMNYTVPETLNEREAWTLVRKAISNSAYNCVEEFEKLPETIQAAVGSPQMLKNMAIDQDFNEAVESSNFMRSYKTAIAREKEILLTSPETRSLLRGERRELGNESKNLLGASKQN